MFLSVYTALGGCDLGPEWTRAAAPCSWVRLEFVRIPFIEDLSHVMGGKRCDKVLTYNVDLGYICDTTVGSRDQKDCSLL